jgi:hypothetical protein
MPKTKSSDSKRKQPKNLTELVKSLPDWVKWGVYFVLVYGIISLILIPFGEPHCGGFMCITFPYSLYPTILVGFIAMLVLDNLDIYFSDFMFWAIVAIFASIIYFIIGARIRLMFYRA